MFDKPIVSQREGTCESKQHESKQQQLLFIDYLYTAFKQE